jgi:hypothetical protein
MLSAHVCLGVQPHLIIVRIQNVYQADSEFLQSTNSLEQAATCAETHDENLVNHDATSSLII